MSIPCRCNRRGCQARRSLPKHPGDYVRWPRCRVCGEGKLYVDYYRMRKGPKDRAPMCTDPYCQFQRRSGLLIPYHRTDSPHCDNYNRCVTPRSRHSPIPAEEWVPF